MSNRWMHICLSLFICSGWQAHIVHMVQAEAPDHAMSWNPLPNGLMSLAYDRTGDGIADYFTLHPVAWSGWSAQNIEEIEHQACLDEQWVFVVEYANDRYVYLTIPTPIFVGDDPEQTGRWKAQKVSPSDVQVSPDINITGHKPGQTTCSMSAPNP